MAINRVHENGHTTRDWRAENGYTIAELAAKGGDAPSAVGNFESGERWFTPLQSLVYSGITGFAVKTLGGPRAVEYLKAARALHRGES